MEDGALHIEIGTLIGICFAFIIPTVLFWWRLHYVVRSTHEMHKEPDEHGFGSETTNTLLLQHMKEEAEQHRESIDATKRLTHTIRELSHYVRWMSQQQTGKAPPPYVRNGGS